MIESVRRAKTVRRDQTSPSAYGSHSEMGLTLNWRQSHNDSSGHLLSGVFYDLGDWWLEASPVRSSPVEDDARIQLTKLDPRGEAPFERIEPGCTEEMRR
jgi:hypothetical protein